MKRREFIALVGGTAVTWTLAARAQQSARMRRIGVLMNTVSDDAEGQARLAAFHQGLQQLGWTVGHNVRIDYRWGAYDAERGRTGAVEFIYSEGIRMRIAIYARVSTDGKGQDPENQLRQLREWCAAAGHEIVREYIDKESGRKGTKGRRQFAELFEDAHKRKFDSVLFWSLDRFSREGMVPTILHLQHLTAANIGLHSYTEPHLATDNELVRNILLSVLSSLAKVEAQKIGERTRAGMAKAKARGKHIGRPSLSPKIQERIAERIAAGETPYRIAKDLGIDRNTAMKYARPFEASAAA